MPHRGSIGKGAFAFLEVPLPPQSMFKIRFWAVNRQSNWPSRTDVKAWTAVHSARAAESTTTAGNSNASHVLIGTPASRQEYPQEKRHVPRSDMVFSPAGTVSKQVTGMSAQQEHQAEADVAQSQNTVVIFASRSNHLLSTRARKHCLRVTAIRGTSVGASVEEWDADFCALKTAESSVRTELKAILCCLFLARKLAI